MDSRSPPTRRRKASSGKATPMDEDKPRYLLADVSGITSIVDNTAERRGAIEITDTTTVTLRGGVEGTSMRITNLLDPQIDSDAATKLYVDTHVVAPAVGPAVVAVQLKMVGRCYEEDSCVVPFGVTLDADPQAVISQYATSLYAGSHTFAHPADLQRDALTLARPRANYCTQGFIVDNDNVLSGGYHPLPLFVSLVTMSPDTTLVGIVLLFSNGDIRFGMWSTALCHVVGSFVTVAKGANTSIKPATVFAESLLVAWVDAATHRLLYLRADDGTNLAFTHTPQMVEAYVTALSPDITITYTTEWVIALAYTGGASATQLATSYATTTNFDGLDAWTISTLPSTVNAIDVSANVIAAMGVVSGLPAVLTTGASGPGAYHRATSTENGAPWTSVLPNATGFVGNLSRANLVVAGGRPWAMTTVSGGNTKLWRAADETGTVGEWSCVADTGVSLPAAVGRPVGANAADLQYLAVGPFGAGLWSAWTSDGAGEVPTANNGRLTLRDVPAVLPAVADIGAVWPTDHTVVFAALAGAMVVMCAGGDAIHSTVVIGAATQALQQANQDGQAILSLFR